MILTLRRRGTPVAVALVASVAWTAATACGVIGSNLGGGDAGPKIDAANAAIDSGTRLDGAATSDAVASDAAMRIDAAAPSDAGMALSREEVLDPDWLPESTIAKKPIPTTATFYVATNGSDGASGAIGSPFATIQHAIDLASPGAVILVRAGTYKQHALFSSTQSGTSSAFITLASYPGEMAVIDGTGTTLSSTGVAGLLEVDGSYVRISGLTVQNVAGTAAQMGILVQNGAHVVIDHNHTIQTASAGIGAWYGQSVLIRDNLVQDGRTTGTQECLSLNGTTTFEVSFNTIWNTQAWAQKCEGLDVKNGSANGRVVGNTSHDLPYEGIYVDAFGAATHDIDVYANLVYGCTIGIALNSEVSGALTNIRVFDNLVHDTAFMGIGFPAWGGSPNMGSISAIAIYNNTIDNRSDPYPTNPSGISFAYPTTSNVTVQNNIVATNGTAFVFTAGVANLLVDHNLVLAPQTATGDAGFSDPNLVQGDPSFVNVDGGDYHLSASSPAIDHGTSAVGLAYDYDGVARPQGSAIDMGAFEYVQK